MRIYYDGMQEGLWFQSLHSALTGATLDPFPSITNAPTLVAQALSYDRPDIILTDDDDRPILILERTIEVPSGHNVGQRFPRLVGAAKIKVPAVYFCPFKAYKHGGETQGPRFMNLRFFYAVERMVEIEDTATTIINWPVDSDCEIIQRPEKDNHVREYLRLFFDYYDEHGLDGMIQHIMHSPFEHQRLCEREDFASTEKRRPEKRNSTPPSVKIGATPSLMELAGFDTSALIYPETVLYKIGMNYIRSDPYTGTALLYSYLYCDGHPSRTRNIILHFPSIPIGKWRDIGNAGGRKDERLFKRVADGILFQDGYLPKSDL